jgi:glycosyltransferase involved in cell wall biosynthesis
MPQAVTEATACGLPVVATRVGAISEMVEDAVTGYLVPPRNPRALRDALAALLADGERRRAMGDRSRVLAERSFDARRNNTRILDLMKQLAEERQLQSRPA